MNQPHEKKTYAGSPLEALIQAFTNKINELKKQYPQDENNDTPEKRRADKMFLLAEEGLKLIDTLLIPKVDKFQDVFKLLDINSITFAAKMGIEAASGELKRKYAIFGEYTLLAKKPEKPEEHQFYLHQTKDGLSYTVSNPKGTKVTKKLDRKELEEHLSKEEIELLYPTVGFKKIQQAPDFNQSKPYKTSQYILSEDSNKCTLVCSATDPTKLTPDQIKEMLANWPGYILFKSNLYYIDSDYYKQAEKKAKLKYIKCKNIETVKSQFTNKVLYATYENLKVISENTDHHHLGLFYYDASKDKTIEVRCDNEKLIQLQKSIQNDTESLSDEQMNHIVGHTSHAHLKTKKIKRFLPKILEMSAQHGDTHSPYFHSMLFELIEAMIPFIETMSDDIQTIAPFLNPAIAVSVLHHDTIQKFMNPKPTLRHIESAEKNKQSYQYELELEGQDTQYFDAQQEYKHIHHDRMFYAGIALSYIFQSLAPNDPFRETLKERSETNQCLLEFKAKEKEAINHQLSFYPQHDIPMPEKNLNSIQKIEHLEKNLNELNDRLKKNAYLKEKFTTRIQQYQATSLNELMQERGVKPHEKLEQTKLSATMSEHMMITSAFNGEKGCLAIQIEDIHQYTDFNTIKPLVHKNAVIANQSGQLFYADYTAETITPVMPQPCGFIKVNTKLRLSDYKKNNKSCYILTDNNFIYYDNIEKKFITIKEKSRMSIEAWENLTKSIDSAVYGCHLIKISEWNSFENLEKSNKNQYIVNGSELFLWTPNSEEPKKIDLLEGKTWKDFISDLNLKRNCDAKQSHLNIITAYTGSTLIYPTDEIDEMQPTQLQKISNLTGHKQHFNRLLNACETNATYGRKEADIRTLPLITALTGKTHGELLLVPLKTDLDQNLQEKINFLEEDAEKIKNHINELKYQHQDTVKIWQKDRFKESEEQEKLLQEQCATIEKALLEKTCNLEEQKKNIERIIIDSEKKLRLTESESRRDTNHLVKNKMAVLHQNILKKTAELHGTIEQFIVVKKLEKANPQDVQLEVERANKQKEQLEQQNLELINQSNLLKESIKQSNQLPNQKSAQTLLEESKQLLTKFDELIKNNQGNFVEQPSDLFENQNGIAEWEKNAEMNWKELLNKNNIPDDPESLKTLTNLLSILLYGDKKYKYKGLPVQKNKVSKTDDDYSVFTRDENILRNRFKIPFKQIEEVLKEEKNLLCSHFKNLLNIIGFDQNAINAYVDHQKNQDNTVFDKIKTETLIPQYNVFQKQLEEKHNQLLQWKDTQLQYDEFKKLIKNKIEETLHKQNVEQCETLDQEIENNKVKIVQLQQTAKDYTKLKHFYEKVQIFQQLTQEFKPSDEQKATQENVLDIFKNHIEQYNDIATAVDQFKESKYLESAKLLFEMGQSSFEGNLKTQLGFDNLMKHIKNLKEAYQSLKQKNIEEQAQGYIEQNQLFETYKEQIQTFETIANVIDQKLTLKNPVFFHNALEQIKKQLQEVDTLRGQNTLITDIAELFNAIKNKAILNQDSLENKKNALESWKNEVQQLLNSDHYKPHLTIKLIENAHTALNTHLKQCEQQYKREKTVHDIINQLERYIPELKKSNRFSFKARETWINKTLKPKLTSYAQSNNNDKDDLAQEVLNILQGGLDNKQFRGVRLPAILHEAMFSISTCTVLIEEPMNIDDVELEDKKLNTSFKTLDEAIKALGSYHEKIKNKLRGQDNIAIQGMIINLDHEFKRFKKDCSTQGFDKKLGFEAFEKRFLKTLHSVDTHLHQHRSGAGARVMGNIAIALTGIGLIILGLKLLISKASTGRFVFFGDKTTRQKHRDNIEHQVGQLGKQIK